MTSVTATPSEVQNSVRSFVFNTHKAFRPCHVYRHQLENSVAIYILRGYAVAQLVQGTALQAGRPRVRFPMVSLEFFIDILLPAAASNRNE